MFYRGSAFQPLSESDKNDDRWSCCLFLLEANQDITILLVYTAAKVEVFGVWCRKTTKSHGIMHHVGPPVKSV